VIAAGLPVMRKRFAIRYTPGTELAARFGSEPTSLHFHTRDGAEQLRTSCANAEHMDVVEVSP
jgi:hypothetical protein